MNDIIQKLPHFINNHLELSILFVLLLLGLVFTHFAMMFRKFKELTPAGLTHLINRESPLLIDLSAIADYEKMHVPGAKHVAMSQFDPEHKDLAKAKELPLVVMDKDGRTTEKAAQRLVKAGFTHVYILGGGVLAWQAAQLPTAKGRN